MVWLGAQVLCQSHCWSSACVDESGAANSHAEQASDSHHGDENTPDHEGGSSNASCDTLKTALSGNAAPLLVTPDFSVLYSLAPLAQLSDAMMERNALISRQPPDREMRSTPEVYLGPAFRSQAPPVLI